jgi:hypothetical protein
VDQRDRQAIDELFGKLRQVEAQTRQRDSEAESYISQQVSQLPAAPYYMAQAIVAQEQALANLHTRVQQLEQQMAQRPAGGGGFLSGLFGGGQSAPPPRQPAMPPGYMQQQGYGQPGMGGHGSPWGGGRGFGGGGFGGGGGGFLAGAMQTAVGVAGGMLVANALTSAFDSSTVSEGEMAGMVDPASHDAAADQADAGFQEAGYEDPGFDAGGDFGGEEI